MWPETPFDISRCLGRLRRIETQANSRSDRVRGDAFAELPIQHRRVDFPAVRETELASRGAQKASYRTSMILSAGPRVTA